MVAPGKRGDSDSAERHAPSRAHRSEQQSAHAHQKKVFRRFLRKTASTDEKQPSGLQQRLNLLSHSIHLPAEAVLHHFFFFFFSCL